jgi:hypothetical protein
MRRKLPLGVLVILVLAVVSLPAASASSAPTRSSAGDDKKVEVIRLSSISVQDASLDLGAQGDSLGDQLVFSDDLFRHGEKVGTSGGVCTLVRLDPPATFAAQCVATLQLPKGQITVQGLINFAETGPFQVAITGGTGRYKTAHGVMTVVGVSDTEDRLTLRIIR